MTFRDRFILIKLSVSPLEQTVLLCLSIFFLYSYEIDFIQKLIKLKRITEAKAVNLTFRYIEDVLSNNNLNFTNETLWQNRRLQSCHYKFDRVYTCFYFWIDLYLNRSKKDRFAFTFESARSISIDLFENGTFTLQ